MNKVTNSTNIPPRVGMAIGFITSLPVLVDHIIGIKATTVVVVVITRQSSPLYTPDKLIC